MDLTLLSLVGRLRWLLPVLLVMLLAVVVFLALPPRTIIIEAGPEAGTWYQDALKLRTFLAARGIEVKIRTTDASMTVIADVNRANSDVDVGFAVHSLENAHFRRVTTLGTIEYQPLFVFYRASLGELSSLVQLRGKRIILPPTDSAAARSMMPLLGALGLSPNNTTITFRPLSDRLAALMDGDADAGLVILSPDAPLIRELAARPDLRIMDFPQAEAIERTFLTLHQTGLPRGSFNLETDVPPNSLHLVALLSDVVVRDDLHPAIIYLLLQAMSEEFGRGDLTTRMGEFPSARNRELTLNKFASDYYRAGLPWHYRYLPLWLGSVIGYYIAMIIPMIVLLPVYNLLNLPSFKEVFKAIQRYLWQRALSSIEQRLDNGVPLGHSYRRALSVIEYSLQPDSSDKTCREALERIRTKQRLGGVGSVESACSPPLVPR